MEQTQDKREKVEVLPAPVDDMHPSKGNIPLMRSRADDLPIWQTLWRYKAIGLIAMAAAFSASLDGYREMPPTYRADGNSGAD